MTYRDFHTPELSSHLASHLKSNLGCNSHEYLLSGEGTGNDTLTGNGAVHTKELLDGVVLVLPVAGEDHHDLTNNWKVLTAWKSTSLCLKNHTTCKPGYK